jgi:tryptophan synthase alpha chain
MSRIAQTFAALKRPALITFITAGDPDYEKSLTVLKSLPEAGADIIEIGMPFSDPMADGAAIQAANIRALDAGANMQQTLKMVQQFRKENKTTPLVLMGYANPIHIYGIKEFIADFAAAGIDGLIVVDLPPEEDNELRTAAQKAGIDLIRLLTPTTDANRLPKVLEGASGFLYYVSITGVTGTAKADTNKIAPHIAQIKKATNLPLAVGFGIKTPEDAVKMAKLADGVVIGSAIVQNIADNQNNPKLAEIIKNQVKSIACAIA